VDVRLVKPRAQRAAVGHLSEGCAYTSRRDVKFLRGHCNSLGEYTKTQRSDMHQT